jgi:hypothetical protein
MRQNWGLELRSLFFAPLLSEGRQGTTTTGRWPPCRAASGNPINIHISVNIYLLCF